MKSPEDRQHPRHVRSRSLSVGRNDVNVSEFQSWVRKRQNTNISTPRTGHRIRRAILTVMAPTSTRGCGFILHHIRTQLHRMPVLILPSSTQRLFGSGRQAMSRPVARPSTNMIGKLRPLQQPPRIIATPRPILNHVPLHDSYARTLASKPSPTLLYLGPTSNTYIIVCYGLSAFCVSYGLWNLFDVCWRSHPGLWVKDNNIYYHDLKPQYLLLFTNVCAFQVVIPVFMGGVCVIMIGLGGYVGLSASRLLKSVTAVPVKGVGAGQGSDLILRFESRRILAVFPSKVMEYSPKDLRLAKRISTPKDIDPTIRGPQAQAKARRDMEAERSKEKAYEMAHLWSAPFRHFARGVRKAIDTFSRVVSREGFVKIYIKGKSWGIDAKTGWMLDEGQGMFIFRGFDRTNMIRSAESIDKTALACVRLVICRLPGEQLHGISGSIRVESLTS